MARWIARYRQSRTSPAAGAVIEPEHQSPPDEAESSRVEAGHALTESYTASCQSALFPLAPHGTSTMAHLQVMSAARATLHLADIRAGGFPLYRQLAVAVSTCQAETASTAIKVFTERTGQMLLNAGSVPASLSARQNAAARSKCRVTLPVLCVLSVTPLHSSRSRTP